MTGTASKSPSSSRGQTMKRFDLVKRPEGWATESDGKTVRGTKAPTKTQAVQQARAAARRAPEPISLKSTRPTGESKRSALTRAPRTRARVAASRSDNGAAPRVRRRRKDGQRPRISCRRDSALGERLAQTHRSAGVGYRCGPKRLPEPWLSASCRYWDQSEARPTSRAQSSVGWSARSSRARS